MQKLIYTLIATLILAGRHPRSPKIIRPINNVRIAVLFLTRWIQMAMAISAARNFRLKNASTARAKMASGIR